MKAFQGLPFLRALAKGCCSHFVMLFGSHKPTTVSGFPPETVLQPSTRLRYCTQRFVQRLNTAFFGKENHSWFHKHPNKLKSNKDPMQNCLQSFLLLPKWDAYVFLKFYHFIETYFDTWHVSTLRLSTPRMPMDALTRPAKTLDWNGSRYVALFMYRRKTSPYRWKLKNQQLRYLYVFNVKMSKNRKYNVSLVFWTAFWTGIQVYQQVG